MIQNLREAVEAERQAHAERKGQAKDMLQARLDEADELDRMAHETVRTTRAAADEAMERIRSLREERLDAARKTRDQETKVAHEEVRAKQDQAIHEVWMDAFEEAFARRSAELQKLFSARGAKRYFDTIVGVTEGDQSMLANGIAGLDREALKAELVKHGMTEIETDLLLDSLKGDGKTGPGHFRRKTNLDDMTQFVPEKFKSAKNADSFGISVRDLTVRDAEKVFHKYARQTLGHAAIARAGFESPGALRAHIADVTNFPELKRMHPQLLESKVKKARKTLELYADRIQGRPTAAEARSPEWTKAARVLSNFNF